MVKIGKIFFLFFLSGHILVVNCQTPVKRQEKSGNEISELKLKESGAKMHTKFPSSTRPLHLYEVTGWLDDMIRLKVEIDKKELDAFINDSPFSAIELDKHKRYVNDDSSLPWWKPSTAANYQSAEVILPGAKHLGILINLDPDTKATIYLEWFET